MSSEMSARVYSSNSHIGGPKNTCTGASRWQAQVLPEDMGAAMHAPTYVGTGCGHNPAP